MSKRFLIVLSESQDADGEGWKHSPVDLEAVRRQVHERLQDQVPVVVLPPGACLTVIEWGENEAGGGAERVAEKKTDEGDK